MTHAVAHRFSSGVAGALAALGVLLVAACGHPRMPLPHSAETYEPPPPVSGAFYAGAALADVTPPPGSSTFGHAVDAHVANGYWTRLYCRAFVLVNQAPTSQAVAIVPCELAAMSTLLQRSVATKLADLPIPAQRLFISAIHTHAGPAHYFDGSFYGGIASSQVPGFDPQMLDFLASRIAGAVRDAYNQAAKARSENRPAELRWMHGLAWGLTHNRSLAAFRLNAPQFVPPPDPISDADPASRAIDPNLDILEISEKALTDPSKSGAAIGSEKPHPIGWITFFGMHPTVLPSSNRYFGSDAFGVACRLVEQELRRQAWDRDAKDRPPPLMGLVNTNEGDLSPRWSVGSVDETVSIGRQLAEHILRVWKDGDAPSAGQPPVRFEENPRIATSYLEVHLPGNDYGLLPGQKLCDRAVLGLASIWGASDHRSMLIDARDVTAPDYDLHRLRQKDCQGPKRQALGFLQSAMGGAGAFPAEVPLGLAQIGDTSIAFVPAEVTSTVGHRITDRVIAASAPSGVTHAVIGGLSNGYFEYVATPEEYQLQLYEGGSTLYGPYTAPFLAANFENMAQRLVDHRLPAPPGTKPDVAQAYEYETGPVRNRLAASKEDPVIGSSLGICQRPTSSDANAAPRICFAWLDGPPNLVSSPPNRAVALVAVDYDHAHASPVHMTMVNALSGKLDAAQLDSSHQAFLSDSGFDFRTMIHGRSADEWLWTTLFEPTTEEWHDLTTQSSNFVFRVGDAARGQAEVRSGELSFRAGVSKLAECTPEQARFCGMAE